MMTMFLEMQNDKDIQKYGSLLAVVGSLSGLFSDSNVPYLHYRTSENLFCLCFSAENLSRADVAVDALKGNIGIGIKTFLHQSGATSQKVAEFNRALTEYVDKTPLEIAQIVSSLRNERLDFVRRTYDTNELIYHLITRTTDGLEIHEERMDNVELSRIKLSGSSTDKGISFSDGIHEYNFNRSKSTLFKKFNTKNRLLFVPVTILKNPFELLEQLAGEKREVIIPESLFKSIQTKPSVVLPLYSPKKMEVQAKSGLNQWNGLGRLRDQDEAYIPVPSWIHRKFEGFFPYNPHTDEEGKPFELILPNGKRMSAKICQQGGKALMSNPNKDLGQWLLRKVLNLKPYELLTYAKLEKIGIDSVVIEKESENVFKIDFTRQGTYEEFADEYNGGKR